MRRDRRTIKAPAIPGPSAFRGLNWGNASKSIPRISRDRSQTAAFGGIRLHGLDKQKGRRSAPELVFSVVAGPGFEPG